MPDPYAKYPGLARQAAGSDADPISMLKKLMEGNKSSQYVGGLPKNLRRITQAKARAKRRSTPSNSVSDLGPLEAMLTNMMNSGSPDMASLQADLRKAIAGQYNPQISNIQKEMGSAKKRAAGAKRDIGSLYDDLTSYYEGQVAPTKARGKAAKAEAQHNATALKNSITDDYANRLREQVDMYKQLGIEAAAPSATEGQMSDQTNALAVAENTAGAEEAALNQQEAADIAYWTEGAGISESEGAEHQATITEQLQNYLNQQGNQLAVLKGQKEAAYNTGMLEMKQQAAQDAMRQQNELWNRMLELAKLKMSMSNAAGSSSRTPTKGLLGALSMLDPRQRTEFQTSLSRSSLWSGSPQAKQYYGGTGPTTPEQLAQVIRDDAANRGLSAADQLAMWQAALAYYNRMR